MRPPFQFFMRKDATTYYKTGGKIVLETPTATPLQHGPNGWDSIQESFARNEELHGIMTLYTNDYQWTRDGALILRHISYIQGVGAKCQLEIRKLNHTTQLYEPYLIGDFNFNEDVEDDRDYFGIKLLQSGLASKLAANVGTEYQIPLLDSDPDLIKVKLNSLKAQGEATWVTTFPPTELLPGHPFTGYPPYVDVSFYAVTAAANTDTKMIVGPNNQLPIHCGNPSIDLQNSYYMRTFANIYDLTFTGTLKYAVNNGSGSSGTFTLRWIVIDVLSGLVVDSQNAFTGTVLASSLTTFNIVPAAAFFTSVAAGHTVQLQAVISGATDYYWEEGHTITATWKNFTPNVYLKGLRYYVVMQRLVALITDGQYPFASQFLSDLAATYGAGIDNRPWDTIITSGDGIRYLPDAVLKVSLTNAYKDADVRWNVGMDTDNDVARIEKKSRYYDGSGSPIFLGPASDVKMNVDAKRIYTSMKIGYQAVTYDEVNGRDEFNTTAIFKFPVDMISSQATSPQLDLVSPWRSDMWGIFFTWTNYVLSQTKDSGSDNSIFVIEINPNTTTSTVWHPFGPPTTETHYTPLSLTPNTPTTGLIDPDNSFNFGFSPGHNLRRSGSIIRASLVGLESEYLTYQTMDKNPLLRTDLASGVIIENADILIGSLAAPLFLPRFFMIEIATDENLSATIRANPYKEYYTTWLGRTYYGFLINATVKGAHRDKFTFQLQASTRNDLPSLIR